MGQVRQFEDSFGYGWRKVVWSKKKIIYEEIGEVICQKLRGTTIWNLSLDFHLLKFFSVWSVSGIVPPIELPDTSNFRMSNCRRLSSPGSSPSRPFDVKFRTLTKSKEFPPSSSPKHSTPYHWQTGNEDSQLLFSVQDDDAIESLRKEAFCVLKYRVASA